MVNKNLIVKDSSVHGKGLFSAVSFREGQLITMIYGEEITANECIRRENEESNVYIFYKDEDIYIDAADNTHLRYLNHSCNYNCDIDEDENGNLILYAIEDIAEGEELTIDYGYEEIYDFCSCLDCDNKSNSHKAS